MEFARICFLRDEAIKFGVVIKGPRSPPKITQNKALSELSLLRIHRQANLGLGSVKERDLTGKISWIRKLYSTEFNSVRF